MSRKPPDDFRAPPNAHVLVCGGRDYHDRDRVFRVLDRIAARFGIGRIVHGAARGADSLAGAWAAARGVECIACPADWDRYGKAAGFKRNSAMLRDHNPDVVLAFPGGAGTAQMCKLAEAARVEVWRVPDAT